MFFDFSQTASSAKNLLGVVSAAQMFPANTVCHSRVPFCNATSVMGDEAEQDSVVPNIDIRMMAGVFGQRGHPIHKRHRFDKVTERPFTYELSLVELPVRVFPQDAINFGPS
jgi:hypothetical protein